MIRGETVQWHMICVFVLLAGCKGTVFNPSPVPRGTPPASDRDTGSAPSDTFSSADSASTDSATSDTGVEDSGGTDTSASDTGTEPDPAALMSAARLLGEPHSMAGTAVAAGDFNDDGYGDLVIGAPGYDLEDVDHPPMEPPAGAVHVAFGPFGGDRELVTAEVRIPGPTADMLGAALAVGDTNGDGALDLVVGAPRALVGGIVGGAVYILPGPFMGPATLPDPVVSGTMADAHVGFSLAVADWNGDGRDDVLGGAPDADSGRGAVALNTGDSFTYYTAAAGSRLGYAVASGDLDGDGTPDAVVSAVMGDGPVPDTGIVSIFERTDENLLLVTHRILGEDPNDMFGKAVAVGDLDADGYDDLVVSAPWASMGGVTRDGIVYIINGPITGDVTVPHATSAVLRGGQTAAEAGESLGITGDVNLDGNVDLLVGQPRRDGASLDVPDSGRGWLVYGPFNGVHTLETVGDRSMDGGAMYDRFGMRVVPAGDLVGDGGLDFVFTAPYAATTSSRSGIVYLFDN